MKKMLICFMVCLLAGCTVYNPVINFEQEPSKSDNESSTPVPANPNITEEPTPVLTEKAKAESQLETMSGEEKRKLNVFFSNFAETYFDEYDCNNISDQDLINFAFLHNRVNLTSKEEYQMFESPYFEYIMGIRVEVMDEIINRYFGVSVPHKNTVYKDEHGSYTGWVFENGYVYTGAATGEFYDFCAVVTSFTYAGDGTYIAKYDKYSTELGEMNNKYYSYTPNQAQNDRALEYCSSYSAVVKPAVVDGKDTWQLLKLKEI